MGNEAVLGAPPTNIPSRPVRPKRVIQMVKIGLTEFKANACAILRALEPGQSMIVTRHGKPCARVTGSVAPHAPGKPLRSLRGSRKDLPDLAFEDFLALKRIWDPKPIGNGESSDVRCE